MKKNILTPKLYREGIAALDDTAGSVLGLLLNRDMIGAVNIGYAVLPYLGDRNTLLPSGNTDERFMAEALFLYASLPDQFFELVFQVSQSHPVDVFNRLIAFSKLVHQFQSESLFAYSCMGASGNLVADAFVTLKRGFRVHFFDELLLVALVVDMPLLTFRKYFDAISKKELHSAKLLLMLKGVRENASLSRIEGTDISMYDVLNGYYNRQHEGVL